MTERAIVVAAGRAALQRIKKSHTLEDWVAVGRALLVGRKFAMAKARADQPKGGKYVKYFGWWPRDNGFADMPNSARNCAMQIAQNEKAVLAWLAVLPPMRRVRQYPQVVWSAYRTEVLKKETKRGWRGLRIDGATALQAPRKREGTLGNVSPESGPRTSVALRNT